MSVGQLPLQVMIVDDNPVIRTGLASLLEARGVCVVAEAGDGRRAIELAETLRPDVVLLDVRMPHVDGVAAAGAISGCSQVLMLTYSDEPAIVRAAFGNGAVGYLVHGTFSAAELHAAVQDAARGTHALSSVAISALVGAVREAPPAASAPQTPQDGYGLSGREREVMDLIAQGRSNGEIANELYLSEKTVKNHINRIYAKLAVTARATAVARWLGTAPAITEAAGR